MPSLKALRNRIRTVDNTKQITRAMKTVAASKMRRTEESLRAGRPYAQCLEELVARLVSAAGEITHPFVVHRPVERSLVVVVTADRGLCGAFNGNIIRRAEVFLQKMNAGAVDLICVGKKGRDYFRRQDRHIVAEYVDLGGKLDVARIRGLTDDIIRRFLDGEADEIFLVYNTYVSVVTYRPKVVKFLPLEAESLGAGVTIEPMDYIFEPNASSILENILPRYLNSKMYITLAETFTAEHSARMVAMGTANDNCEELLDTLTLDLNKARQASITKELLEIVGGAEVALKG
ncbi:MAG: ATP synthase F1 subunit gamma [bacterium]